MKAPHVPRFHAHRKNQADLTRYAEDILLACEAHERNDGVLERIYIGRRFRNDTERLEKLFELYTKMTKTKGAA
jgi:hypothetical protein